mgnify:FL=1
MGIVICTLLAGAYAFYVKNKDIAFAVPPQQTETGEANSPGTASSDYQASDSRVTDNSDVGNDSDADRDDSGSESPDNASDENKVMAPDFGLKNLDGETVKLSDYRGKIVILNFWATWCYWCKVEMPDFNELNEELEKEDEAVILAVNVEESKDTVVEYLTSENINLKVLLDEDGAVARTYGVTGLPNTFIINKDGSVYGYIPGATDRDALEKVIDKVKKGEPVR